MAFNWGRGFGGAGTGALTGASIGSAVPGIGTAVGAGVGGLLGLLGGFGDEDVEEPLNQIPDEMKQYLLPYITGGQNAFGRAGTEYGNLLNDPNAIISRIGAGYKQSPGYQWRLNQGEQGITNAAAAGGMAGTAKHQQQAGELAINLASQDYNDYMKNALGLYGTGLEGEMNLAKLGQGSASDLATSIANLLGSKSLLRYAGNANRNSMSSGLMQAILQNLPQIHKFAGQVGGGG